MAAPAKARVSGRVSFPCVYRPRRRIERWRPFTHPQRRSYQMEPVLSGAARRKAIKSSIPS